MPPANVFRGQGDLNEKIRHLLYEVNCHAPYDLMQQAILDMKEAGAGHIVNVSSRTSEHPQGPPYNAFNADGHRRSTRRLKRLWSVPR